MIEGKQINLRPIEEEDATVFHRWFNDPEVTRFLGGNAFPALSMAQERHFIERLRDDNGRRGFMITLKDGTPIGSCTLRTFDWTARSCEVGIAIGEKQYWGKGYGGEALQILQEMAFNNLNLHKLWLTCAAYNQRGLRAYRRIGFREDGRLRDDRFLDGRYHDTIVMSILEHEWYAASGTAALAHAEVDDTLPSADAPPVTDGQAMSSEASTAAATDGQATSSEAPLAPEAEGLEAPAEASAEPSSPSVFTITLEKTYYNQGFFNVPAYADPAMRQEEGPLELALGDSDQRIAGRLDRRANPNRTARIFGGAKLRNWFKRNFHMLEQVEVEIVEPDLLRVTRLGA